MSVSSITTTSTPVSAQPDETTRGMGDGRTDVVVALAQVAPRLGDLDHNLGRHQALIREAADQGAHLVIFPELSVTGYFLKDLVPEVALRLDSPELALLATACGRVDALVGCVLESDDARFYNASVYLSGGQVHHVHRKVYLPTYGLFDELRYFAAGDRFRAFEAPVITAAPHRRWRAGILACEDMWHPTAPALLARQGVDAFFCPSSSPGRGVGRGMALGSERSYDAMTRTYAQLFTAYVVYCNRVGCEDGVGFWGGSRVVGPDGQLLTDPAGRDEALVLHRLDLAAVRRTRVAYPLLRDERHDINDYESDHLRRRRAFH